MKIMNKYDLVKKLLEEREIYRNDYLKLLSRVWADESIREKIHSRAEFLRALEDKRLSHPESIMRVRRKIQEEHPELKGNKEKRKEEEVEVKKELGYQPDLFHGQGDGYTP